MFQSFRNCLFVSICDHTSRVLVRARRIISSKAQKSKIYDPKERRKKKQLRNSSLQASYCSTQTVTDKLFHDYVYLLRFFFFLPTKLNLRNYIDCLSYSGIWTDCRTTPFEQALLYKVDCIPPVVEPAQQ